MRKSLLQKSLKRTMSKFTLLIMVVLVGRIYATVIGTSPSEDLSPIYDRIDDVLLNFTNSLNDEIKNDENQFKSLLDDMSTFDLNELKFDYKMANFLKCTKIKGGYVKYDGTSSCVNTYYDAACSHEQHLSTDADYTVGTFESHDIKVCNKARDVKLYFYVAVVIPIGVALWMYIKCRQCGAKNRNDLGGSTVNLVV